MSLGAGHELFLNEVEGDFGLISKKNARSLARFFVKNNKLGMGVLKAERFPKLADVPADVRGESFVLKTEDGRKLSLEIQGKASAPREINHKPVTVESAPKESSSKPEKPAARRKAARSPRKAPVTRTGKREK